MRNFPIPFTSQKEYDNYLNCLANLKIGDKVIFKLAFGVRFEAVCLLKEFIPSNYHTAYSSYYIVVGFKGGHPYFYKPTLIEKRTILTEAKKICPSIMINSTNILNLSSATRIEKIIKYNGETKKEKKEVKKKPLRPASQNA